MNRAASAILAVTMAGVLPAVPSAAAELAPKPSSTIRPLGTGPAVRALQRRLVQLHYVPGQAGIYDPATRAALWAFQKTNGIRPADTLDGRTRRALAHPRKPRAIAPHGGRSRIEVDLRRQIVTVFAGNRPVLVTHASTGSGRYYRRSGSRHRAITPRGSFRIGRRHRGWHRAPLGWMYKPLYFNHGIAIHGSLDVPLAPASHGCVRVPLPAADALARGVRAGTRVYVR